MHEVAQLEESLEAVNPLSHQRSESCPDNCKDCKQKGRLMTYKSECASTSPNGAAKLEWLTFPGSRYGCGACFNYVHQSAVKTKVKDGHDEL